ncbi:MAG TPA: acyl-CoA thioesterase domain-containing protein, partial [Longimicrobium sp.]|nr:acyl-CoA thioesterase domain-containing protein [Longimicrobium sp.]
MTTDSGAAGEPLEMLLRLLDLERLELNLFRGLNRDIGSGRLFGGQVLAQALVAAGRTVEGRTAHSLHGYFMLAGDVATPVVYQVDRIRDGKSFTTRRVLAIQEGREIFTMTCSFQVPEPGVEHGAPLPDVPAPEALPRELDLVRAMAGRIPEPLRDIYTQDRPIDFRPVAPVDPF